MKYLERKAREQVAAEKFRAGMELIQEATMETETPSRVSFAIPHDRPIQVFSFGDLHAGSINTDIKIADRLVSYILSTPDVYVIFTGDEIEGRKDGYGSTNGVSTIGSAAQQIENFRTTIFEPLAAAGRIMGMVTDYWGHNGWVQDSSTADPWKEIVRDTDVNLVTQGGTIVVSFASGTEVPIQVFHNTPGKSMYDPNHGGRRAQQNLDSGTRQGTVFGAHKHVAGIEQSNQPSSTLRSIREKTGVVSSDPSLVLIQNGTFKSVSEHIPKDPFGKRLGLPLADVAGQGFEVFPGKKGGKLRYPTMTARHGEVMHTALTVLNDLESQQLSAEMRERIAAELEDKPEVTLLPDFSQVNAAGLYDAVWYDITTRLPIRLEFAQNVRYGSEDGGVVAYQEHIAKTLANNPHLFVALLRNIVDGAVSRRSSRDETLAEVAATHRPYAEQVLLLMKDANLSQAAWERTAGKGSDTESLGLDPARYLSQEIGTPLVHNKSVLALSIGSTGEVLHRPTYTTLLLDKLGHNGSAEKPTFGHLRQYQQEEHKPGMVAGGHVPGSGFSMRFDTSNQETRTPLFLAPGWWSSFDALGKGNRGPGAVPGASVIMMPGNSTEKYLAFGAADAQQSEELHDALKLYVGLSELGLLGSVSSWLSMAAQRQR